MKGYRNIALLFFLLTSRYGFSARPVVEVGQNVKVNALTKIEQTKNTLEAIQQTKNQIIQLKNDALNLNKWAGTILQETLGISQQDINNLLDIQRLSSDLYRDAKSFEKNWKKEFNLDYTKLDIHQLGETHQDTLRRIDDLNKDMLKFEYEMEKKAKELSKNVQKFNTRNSQVMGNVDSTQLSNEIMTSIYSSINTLSLQMQEYNLQQHKKELMLEEKKKQGLERQKQSYIKTSKRTKFDDSYEVIYF